MDDVKAKIRKLLRITEGRGATEAEALTAAAKARELLDRHQLSMTAADLEETGAPDVREESVEMGGKRLDRIHIISAWVAEFCDCKALRSTGPAGSKLLFIGLSADAEMAAYLFQLVRRARDDEWSVYKRTASYDSQTLRGFTATQVKASFTDGLMHRVCHRLQEIKAESRKTYSGSTALVPIKNALVEAHIAKMDVRRAGRGPAAPKCAEAIRQGMAAGDRINLTRPLSGAKTAGQLT